MPTGSPRFLLLVPGLVDWYGLVGVDSTHGLLVVGMHALLPLPQVLAVGLLKKGFDVQVFERDMTAIRGEGKYRGPIQVLDDCIRGCCVVSFVYTNVEVINYAQSQQVQSNALAALEALDSEVAAEVMATGCITGDRINGLCDGETGDWYVGLGVEYLSNDDEATCT